MYRIAQFIPPRYGGITIFVYINLLKLKIILKLCFHFNLILFVGLLNKEPLKRHTDTSIPIIATHIMKYVLHRGYTQTKYDCSSTEGAYHGPNIATSVHLAIICRINMENFVVLFTHLVCRHNMECKTFQCWMIVLQSVRKKEAFLFSIKAEKLFSFYLLLWKTMFLPLMESSTLSVRKKIDLELCVSYFWLKWGGGTVYLI